MRASDLPDPKPLKGVGLAYMSPEEFFPYPGLSSSPGSERELILQFARQLYDACRGRHGVDHEQTRLALGYMHRLEMTARPNNEL